MTLIYSRRKSSQLLLHHYTEILDSHRKHIQKHTEVFLYESLPQESL